MRGDFFHIDFKSIVRVLIMTMTALAALPCSAQQYSLFSHFHDFPGYYNPALNTSGKYSEVGLAHRSQWTGLGNPTVNTLFIKYPPRLELPAINFNAIGAVLQHEDYDFLKRSSLQLFSSNELIRTKNYSINFGINAGITLNTANTIGLSDAELSDLNMVQLDGTTAMLTKVGIAYVAKNLQLGAASSLNSLSGFSDITATARSLIDIKGTKLTLMPGLIYRLSANTKSLLEAQARIVFDRKIALTAGYRQEYGTLFQLSFLINKLKGSYGAEMPSGKKSALGMTHEMLVTYRFKLENASKIERERLLKKQRDSLNALRLDSLRKARLARYQTAKNEDSTATSPDEREINLSTVKNIEASDDEPATIEDVIEFDEVPRHIFEDKTHVIMRHIQFETGYDILKPYAYHELDKLVHYLKHNKRFTIEIQGHTDDIGTKADNNELSYRRALIVYNYLISRGMEAEKMSVKGYGEDRPLYPNNSDENRAYNRRIEVVFRKNE